MRIIAFVAEMLLHDHDLGTNLRSTFTTHAIKAKLMSNTHVPHEKLKDFLAKNVVESDVMIFDMSFCHTKAKGKFSRQLRKICTTALLHRPLAVS